MEDEKVQSEKKENRLYEKIDIRDYDYELNDEAVDNNAEIPSEKKEKGKRIKVVTLVSASVLLFLAIFVCMKFVLGDRDEKNGRSNGDDKGKQGTTVTAAVSPELREKDFRRSIYPIVEVRIATYSIEDFEETGLISEPNSKEVAATFDGIGTTTFIGFIVEGEDDYFDFITGQYSTIEIQYFLGEAFVERVILNHNPDGYKLETHRYEIVFSDGGFKASHNEIFSDTYYYDDLYESKVEIPYSGKEGLCHILSSVGDPKEHPEALQSEDLSKMFVLLTEDIVALNRYVSEMDWLVKIEHWEGPEKVFADGIPETYGMGTVEDRGRIKYGQDSFVNFLQLENGELMFEYYIGDYIVESATLTRDGDFYAIRVFRYSLLPSEIKPYSIVVDPDNYNFDYITEYKNLAAYRIEGVDEYLYVLCQDTVPELEEVLEMSSKGLFKSCFVLFTGPALGFTASEEESCHVFKANASKSNVVKVQTNDSFLTTFTDPGARYYNLGSIHAAGSIIEGKDVIEDFLTGAITELEIDYYVEDFIVGYCQIINLGDYYHVNVFQFYIWVSRSETEYSFYVNKDNIYTYEYLFDRVVAYRVGDFSENEKAYSYVLCNLPVPDAETMMSDLVENGGSEKGFALFDAGRIAFAKDETEGEDGKEYHVFEDDRPI